MLAKKYRINQNKEYNAVFNGGVKVIGRYIIVYILANNLDYNRYGIITSKKIGNAVIRNNAKRKLRHLIRDNLQNVKIGHDVVIVARYTINETDFNSLESDFKIVLRKLRIWCVD